MNFFMTNVPNFIKREMEKLQEVIAPLMKKVSKFTMWSFPLIAISIINLFFLLFVVPGERSLVALVIYAAIGAIGMALFKEAKAHKKEIRKISNDYIIERIQKSDIASEHRKNEYITLVKSQPVKAVYHFVSFLEEENRIVQN
ncbi:DUF5392 family protein [Virgibacillus oceani]|uniref:YwnF n=1 Tax=Virgibacillus oceani TaxID=1479511 RepID=A0A917HM63_9BACI|nr:DUF5392 family protein [Virgibacillus oceani]GGG83211.1 hypothetical protein GCM10011398_30990 [Virgibacillus oceani]